MQFLRKKRIKFAVELLVDKLTDVSLLNGTLFAKVRLLECGSFEVCTQPKELRNHVCQLHTPDADKPTFPLATPSAEPPSPDSEDTENRPATAQEEAAEPSPTDSKQQPFRFTCRIPFNEQTGELEECKCKISIRKLERAGRPPTKLGFVTVNLSEFARSGSTPISQSFLLDGYTGSQRQDNTRVHVAIRMSHQIPSSSASNASDTQYHYLNPADRKAPSHHATLDEVRRRMENPAFDSAHADDQERPSSAVGSSTLSGPHALSSIPHSSTHTSFSSAGSDPNQNHSPPQSMTSLNTAASRFSHQQSDRRPSVPSSADRTSWHAGGFASGEQFPSQQVLDLRRNCATRRMSDDRMVASAQNVPNRIQQTRRDADSVVEEVMDALLDDDNKAGAGMEVSGEDEALDKEMAEPQNSQKRGLALFVSRRNGDAVLGTGQNGCPLSSYERVQLDSTMSG